MSGPQLGELEAGSLAALIGAPMSVVVGGIGSLVYACIAAVKSIRMHCRRKVEKFDGV